jgi:1,2-diacylglycerol 3-alpha-glucosyltransferase
MTVRLCWMANSLEQDRERMGRQAAKTVALWGPERFAQGTIEAIELAQGEHTKRNANKMVRESFSPLQRGS